jgi:hypothetical protein
MVRLAPLSGALVQFKLAFSAGPLPIWSTTWLHPSALWYSVQRRLSISSVGWLVAREASDASPHPTAPPSRSTSHESSSRQERFWTSLQHWITVDWVYLKLQPYIQTSLAPHSNQKLAIKFFGPFQIVARVGAVAYKLLLRLSPRSIQFSMYLSWSKLCQSNTRLLICLSPWMVFRCLNLFSNNALLLQTIRLFCRH